jgi:MFS family permease
MTFPTSPDTTVATQTPCNQHGARTATLIAACATMGGIAMTITVASIVLAGVQSELRLGITQLQWVLNSFIVSYALLLLPFGAWSDRSGQRRLFVWGAVVFVMGAAGAVLARDVAVLIGGRAVQGVGAALLTATAPAALTLAFANEAERKRAFGYMGSSGGIGLALGALLAGAVSSWGGWRAALALPIPVMIAALAVVCCSPGALASRLRSHRVGVPMRALLENRSFVLSCVVCVLFTTVWVALFIYGPLHMQAVDGLDPHAVGTVMLSLLLPALVMPIVASRLVLIFNARAVLVGGFLLMAVGLWCMHVAWSGAASRVFELMGLALCGSGAGALYGLVDYLGLSAVSAEQAGLASGAFNVVRLFGDIFAAIIPGAVVLQVVGASLTGVSDAVLGEIAAGDLRVVDHLGLSVQARAAFIDGMQWALWALLTLTAVGALVSLLMRDAKSSRR